MIPTKEQINEKARELWKQDRIRNGDPAFDIQPEPNELAESGYVWLAQLELMRQGNKTYADQFSDLDKIAEKTEQPETQQLEQPQQQQQLSHVLSESEQLPFDINEAMRSGISILGTRQCGKTTLAQQLTDKLMAKGIVVYCIDPTLTWVTRRRDFNVINIPERNGIPLMLTWKFQHTVFDVSTLGTQDAQAFTELFCHATLDTMINLEPQRRPQIWLWFEEAHTPIPNYTFNSAKRLQETKRYITQGANFNCSFGIISQFASMVDKLPVKATQQRYFGLTSEPNDINYIRKFIGKEQAEQLRDLDTGEFLYSYRNILTRFRTQQPATSQPVYNYAMVYQYQNRKPSSLQKKKALIPLYLLLLVLRAGWNSCT